MFGPESNSRNDLSLTEFWLSMDRLRFTKKPIFFYTTLNINRPSQSSLDDKIRTFTKLGLMSTYTRSLLLQHLCFYKEIILIQDDNDNDKLDFFLTKSAVDSLVES